VYCRFPRRNNEPTSSADPSTPWPAFSHSIASYFRPFCCGARHSSGFPSRPPKPHPSKLGKTRAEYEGRPRIRCLLASFPCCCAGSHACKYACISPKVMQVRESGRLGQISRHSRSTCRSAPLTNFLHRGPVSTFLTSLFLTLSVRGLGLCLVPAFPANMNFLVKKDI
jgi:hypothetical protein